MAKRSSLPGSAETNLSRIHEDAGSIPGLPQWVKSGVAVSCGVGRRRGSDLALPWLWCRPAATALIGPLAWEPPHAAGAALKRHTHTQRCQRACLLQLQADLGWDFLARPRAPRFLAGARSWLLSCWVSTWGCVAGRAGAELLW